MNPADAEREAIESMAAEWLARRDRRLTAEEAVAFARWRMADPRHNEAVEELELVWKALDDLSVANGQQPAGGAAAAPPALAPASTSAGQVRRGAASRRWWPVLAMAAALAIGAGVVVWHQLRPVETRYETVVGAQQTLTLPDGSEVHLNTNSALRVRFDARERRVMLERGEGFFQVAKDTRRPFVVAAGGTEARVLGTAFVVRLRERESEVVVAEGRVAFGTGAAVATELRAGQRAVLALSGDGPPRVEMLDPGAIARRLAWQTGMLEFKNTPLREAAAEFNRYHRQQLVLRDPATEAVPVGGTFATSNLDGFVRLLDQSFDVVVVERGADKIVLGLRP